MNYNSGTGVTSVADHNTYDAYGYKISQTDAAHDVLFAYTGRLLDVRDRFQFNGNRWYDTTTRRWLSEDPLGFGGGDTNLTRYVGNSPTNATDPSGLATCDAVFQEPGIDWQPLLEAAADLDARNHRSDTPQMLGGWMPSPPPPTMIHFPPEPPSWILFLEGPGMIIGGAALGRYIRWLRGIEPPPPPPVDIPIHFGDPPYNWTRPPGIYGPIEPTPPIGGDFPPGFWPDPIIPPGGYPPPFSPN